jgi:uracil DNA glycosylase
VASDTLLDVQVLIDPESAYVQAKLETDRRMGKTLYPPLPDTFNAFNACPLGSVKVVILGQVRPSTKPSPTASSPAPGGLGSVWLQDATS